MTDDFNSDGSHKGEATKRTVASKVASLRRRAATLGKMERETLEGLMKDLIPGYNLVDGKYFKLDADTKPDAKPDTKGKFFVIPTEEN